MKFQLLSCLFAVSVMFSLHGVIVHNKSSKKLVVAIESQLLDFDSGTSSPTYDFVDVLSGQSLAFDNNVLIKLSVLWKNQTFALSKSPYNYAITFCDDGDDKILLVSGA